MTGLNVERNGFTGLYELKQGQLVLDVYTTRRLAQKAKQKALALGMMSLRQPQPIL